jgi:hypothetical protein
MGGIAAVPMRRRRGGAILTADRVPDAPEEGTRDRRAAVPPGPASTSTDDHHRGKPRSASPNRRRVAIAFPHGAKNPPTLTIAKPPDPERTSRIHDRHRAHDRNDRHRPIEPIHRPPVGDVEFARLDRHRRPARFKADRPPLERIANADNRRLVGRQDHDVVGTHLFNRCKVSRLNALTKSARRRAMSSRTPIEV